MNIVCTSPFSNRLSSSSRMNERTSGGRHSGEGARVGYFSQDLAQELPEDASPLEHVLRVARAANPTVTEQTARSVLGALGLSAGCGATSNRRLTHGLKDVLVSKWFKREILKDHFQTRAFPNLTLATATCRRERTLTSPPHSYEPPSSTRRARFRGGRLLSSPEFRPNV